jgi:MFS family permease
VTRQSWAAFTALLIFTMGTSIITPLLPLYKETYDLSNGEATLLFATYTAAVVPSMLLLGNVSDSLGRKRVMIPGIIVLTTASLVMGLADSVPMLFVGRALQGIAIGSFLGVGTAFVVDHARADSKGWAASLAGFGFRLGFGLGPGIAGIVAEYAPYPLRLSFLGHAALMSIAFVAVLVTAETVTRRPFKLRVRIGVPPGQMAAFATFLAPAAFLLSFLDATLLSVVPLYMADSLGVQNLAVIGAVGFLVLAMGGLAPFLAPRVEPRRAVMVGAASASSSLLLVLAAAAVDQPVLVLLAAGLIGLLNGFILQGGMIICGISVPIEERGKLISALYMCAYSGTLPTVAIGYVSQSLGLTAALSIAAAAAIGLALFVILVGGRIFREVRPYVEPTPVPA